MGIGVRVLEDDEPPKAIPLIFVPQSTASTREIPMGWYLIAAVGSSSFDIVVSNVHKEDGIHLRGDKLDRTKQCVVGQLFVDGLESSSCLYEAHNTGDRIYTGFIEKETKRIRTERPFQFFSVPTDTGDDSGDIPDGLGTIELKIWLSEMTGETKKISSKV